MIFTSPEFLFYFLPVFLLAYYLLPAKNLTLLSFSLFFYAWGEGAYVLLMLASGLVNWYAALLISRGSSVKQSKIILAVSIAINLANLFFYKYFVFVLSIFITIVPQAHFTVPAILLPIGISFYTFHAISYLIDVYRGDYPAEKKLFNVMLYISMFPQLVAGPIVRFGTVCKDIHKRNVTFETFALGLKFFILGLGMKVLVANTLAAPVDLIFKISPHDLDASTAWLAAIGYSLQIYFDFAGYSTMAIGLGLMVGIHFPLNFNYPYISQSITEFWRRWHITLSTWFRDYLYIPLGGNQKGVRRTYINLVLVFLLCGLWHGANWTFIIWGLYHGLFLVVERAGFDKFLLKAGSEFRHIYLLTVVTIGWIFFRADSMDQAVVFLKAMAGFGTGDGVTQHLWLYLQPDVALALIAGAIGSTPYFSKIGQRVMAAATPAQVESESQYSIVGWFGVLGLFGVLALSVISVASGNYNPFIYFRF